MCVCVGSVCLYAFVRVSDKKVTVQLVENTACVERNHN